MPAAREAERIQLELRQLQARNMRFADQYVGRVIEETGRFRRTLTDPELRSTVSNWRLAQANSAYTAAAGETPIVSTLDLMTLAALSRMVIEDTVLPRFGEKAAPLLAVHRELEVLAWTLSDEFLTKEQEDEVLAIMVEWRKEHPEVTSVAFVSFLDYARQIGRGTLTDTQRRSGLFAAIGIDPLSGIDPAVRQIQQTRLLAERTIFYLQRIPYIVPLQMEVVTSELLLRPEMRGALEDSDRISRSADRLAGVAEGLPAAFASERAALVDQLSNVLVAQQATLHPMLIELRQALEAADTTATSVDSVVRTIDAMIARPRAAAAPGTDPGRPFDIREYTRAAEEITRTANELKLLLTALDETAPVLSSKLDSTVAHGRSLVDHIALLAAVLIMLLIGGTLAAAVAYRRLTTRAKT